MKATPLKLNPPFPSSWQKHRSDAELQRSICPETITEFFCFQSRRCKITLWHQKLILPEAQVGRNYGTETFQIPCKNYGAQR